MKNGTMFASLADYEDKSFYDAHKNIMYDTLYDKGEYEIVSRLRLKSVQVMNLSITIMRI